MSEHHHCHCCSDSCEHEHHHDHHHDHGHDHDHEEAELRLWQPIVCGCMLAIGLVFDYSGSAWLGLSPWLRFAWYFVAFILVGWNVLKESWESAREGDLFSEFLLMSIASIGAFAIGEYPEAVAVMLFYTVGEMLQDRAVSHARSSIKSLVALRPEHATVVNADATISVLTPDQVAVGAVIEVKAGERVPLDGRLLTPAVSFDTAALTGESMPRTIETSDEVLAGMIPSDSVVRLEVTRPAGESAISRILSLVEDATARKAPAELFIRKFARIYTPVVVGIALLVVLFGAVDTLILHPSPFTLHFSDWLHRALIFLVISCPCALVISIPLGYFAGIGAASKRGILFKGSNYLHAIAETTDVVFDKTGTLTQGRFAVSEVKGLSEEDLATLAVLESTSTHPIAQAIRDYRTYSDDKVESSHITLLSGYGLSAEVGEKRWLVGTLRLLEREGVSYPAELSRIEETLVAVAVDGKYRGYLTLSDTLKTDAAAAVQSLSAAGVRSYILSGDKQSLVKSVAATLGVTEGYGDLLPEDKVKKVQDLMEKGERRKELGSKQKTVAFVGDGINDAPVLALSDIGIAMGGLGSEMAIETADVVIQTDQPSRVAEAIRIGRRTNAIVRQNIVFAIAVKVIVMLFGLLGLANLWMAVFADVGVALLCVLNAMRILSPRF